MSVTFEQTLGPGTGFGAGIVFVRTGGLLSCYGDAPVRYYYDRSYYRDVAILAVSYRLCYTVEDAVDWCFDATT